MATKLEKLVATVILGTAIPDRKGTGLPLRPPGTQITARGIFELSIGFPWIDGLIDEVFLCVLEQLAFGLDMGK